MNFLDAIWLIPMFPLLGASGNAADWQAKLDPQLPSPVAVSPDLAETAEWRS